MSPGHGNRLRRIAEPKARILVVGIGRAGGNIIDDLKRLGVLSGFERAKGIHILDGNHHRRRGRWNNGLPTVSLPFSIYSTGGDVQTGRAMALRHRYRLQALLASLDKVILIAGLGGGNGGGIAPHVAQSARNVGALTVAVVTMPFEFEGIRVQRADTAIRRLRRKTAFVFSFSNQQLAMEMGDDALLDTIYEVQSWRIARLLRKLLRHWCGHSRR